MCWSEVIELHVQAGEVRSKEFGSEDKTLSITPIHDYSCIYLYILLC